MPRPRSQSFSPSSHSSGSIHAPRPEHGYRRDIRFSPYYSARLSGSTSTASVTSSRGSDASISSVSEEDEGEDEDADAESDTLAEKGEQRVTVPRIIVRKSSSIGKKAQRTQESQSTSPPGPLAKHMSSLTLTRQPRPTTLAQRDSRDTTIPRAPLSAMPFLSPSLRGRPAPASRGSHRGHRRTQSLATSTYGYVIAPPSPRFAHPSAAAGPRTPPSLAGPTFMGADAKLFQGRKEVAVPTIKRDPPAAGDAEIPARPHSVPSANTARDSASSHRPTMTRSNSSTGTSGSSSGHLTVPSPTQFSFTPSTTPRPSSTNYGSPTPSLKPMPATASPSYTPPYQPVPHVTPAYHINNAYNAYPTYPPPSQPLSLLQHQHQQQHHQSHQRYQQMMLLNPSIAAHLRKGGKVAMRSVDGRQSFTISLPAEARLRAW